MTQAFNLSQLANGVNTSGQLNAATYLYNQVPVANGGTGLSTLTAGYIPYGNGTGAFGSSTSLVYDSSNVRLGVGISSPVTALSVSGALSFTSTVTTPAVGSSFYAPATNSLAFGTASTERMRIDSSGNVGIGTSSPATKLHVEQSTTGDAFKVAKGSNYLIMGGSGSGTQYVKGYEGVVAFGNAFAGATTFLTGDTERMRIDSSGNVLMGITSATSGGGVLQVSNGITFPATQSASSNANTLDDYEEGTWTPSIGGTATYGTVIATYTKIGDTVRLYFDIAISTIGTGSTTTMSGVPFSCTYNDAGAISYFSTLNVTAYFIQAQMSGTNITFPGTTAAQATITNTMTIFKSGTRILGTVVYKTST